MKNIGNIIQYQIYATMENPDPNRLPVVYEDWEKRAREVLDDGPYYYVAGERGVKEVLQNLLADLDITLGLVGENSVRNLDRSVLTGPKEEYQKV